MVAALILKDDIVDARVWDELVVISVNVGGDFLLDFFLFCR